MDIQPCKENEYIKNLTSTKHNNEIQLKWDWPELNTGINYVYIFEIGNKNETLEELKKQGAKHFSVARKNYMENGCYKRTLPNDNIQYKVFPVKMENAETIVLNQETDNVTKTFYKSIIIEYSISAKILRNKRKLQFVFSNTDAITANAEIVYHKYDKNNKYICMYPLSVDLIVNGNYNIIVNNGEQIRLALKDKDSDIIKFRLK